MDFLTMWLLPTPLAQGWEGEKKHTANTQQAMDRMYIKEEYSEVSSVVSICKRIYAVGHKATNE